ncbi:MAG: hypothetical protein IT378_15005 [Sandaracinaceae bacterium]|nr:hypothetical protein [Sandaracinaceae bacterium]
MLTNLTHPWLLARLLSGASAAVLAIVGLAVAYKVLRFYRVGATSEGQLALERRAELVAAIVQLALVLGVVNLALSVLAADRRAGSVRGAMCAWGVFDASAWGVPSLAASALVALGGALWLTLHRLDLRLETPRLTRAKFIALLVVAPLVVIDLLASTAFALDLDRSVVASCCSLGLDSVVEATGASGGARGLAAALALGGGSLAAALGLALRVRPRAWMSWGAAFLSAITLAVALPAILGYVAPHAYETPSHLCPFCLLHADVHGIGWPLFALLGLGSTAGLSLAALELARKKAGAPEQVAALARSLGLSSAIGWLGAIVLGALPVVRYAWITGGASVFGGY